MLRVWTHYSTRKTLAFSSLYGYLVTLERRTFSYYSNLSPSYKVPPQHHPTSANDFIGSSFGTHLATSLE